MCYAPDTFSLQRFACYTTYFTVYLLQTCVYGSYLWKLSFDICSPAMNLVVSMMCPPMSIVLEMSNFHATHIFYRENVILSRSQQKHQRQPNPSVKGLSTHSIFQQTKSSGSGNYYTNKEKQYDSR